ncbi:MAG TPA: enoyl-CoA hydratase/isomerase family protein [Xanthobacteraceae bacterium]|nr:enoyl-CoA hydratase/isomerase family protein [Xanthobacteraceae bacterium]
MADNPPSLRCERLPIDEHGATLGVITFDRPEEMNPLDHAAIGQMRAAIEDLFDDPSVRVLAITGRGKAFSAGGDMKKYMTLQRDPVGFPIFLDDWHTTVVAMAAAPKPIIALINGITVAGGLETVLACDFAIAAQSARIGDAHLNFGQMGGGGVLAMLPRAIGIARARELVFTGRLLSAAEALEWGLINRMVPDDQLLSAGIAIATEMAKKSPLALANAKYVINDGFWHGTGELCGILGDEIDQAAW